MPFTQLLWRSSFVAFRLVSYDICVQVQEGQVHEPVPNKRKGQQKKMT